MQPSMTHNLLSFHGINVIEQLPLKILCLHDLYDINSQKLTYSFIWTFLNVSSSNGESDIRKTIKIIIMLRVRKVLSLYIISL
jgi:hypothetical protein